MKNVEASAKPSQLGGILTVNDQLVSLIHQHNQLARLQDFAKPAGPPYKLKSCPEVRRPSVAFYRFFHASSRIHPPSLPSKPQSSTTKPAVQSGTRPRVVEAILIAN